MRVIKTQTDADDLSPILAGRLRGLWDASAAGFGDIGQTYEPERDGFIVVLQAGDTALDLETAGISERLQDSTPEMVTLDELSGTFTALYIYNNEFGNQFVIPAVLADAIEPGLLDFLQQEAHETLWEG